MFTGKAERGLSRRILLECVLVFLLAAVLIGPLWTLEYLDNWGSIESTFISDARLLNQRGWFSQWQPLWYCGTRTNYIYPPALRYGTAGIAKVGGVSTARAYHLYTAFLFSLGIAGVYFLVRVASRSRLMAVLAAFAAAVLSPSWLLLPVFMNDAGASFRAPMRLHVLMRYGEGPHISALSLMPFALGFAWYGLLPGRARWLGLSALFAALVVSNNFYGAVGLALIFPMLVWALWLGTGDNMLWLRALGLAILAWLLTAFWLTPSYLRVTIENLKWVAQKGNARSALILLAIIAVFCVITYLLARRREALTWPVFVTGASLVLLTVVYGHSLFGWRSVGEPIRLIPELDLVLILLALLPLAWLTARPIWVIAVTGLVIAAGIGMISRYFLQNAWRLYTPAQNIESRVEYRTTDWLKRMYPGGRTMATGSLRFWFNAWHDLAQVGGGSEQGLINPVVMVTTWYTRVGSDGKKAALWLQALGADAIVVADKTSQDVYHDIEDPLKFEGVLELAHDDGAGNRIYSIPRKYPGQGRLILGGSMNAVKDLMADESEANVSQYVAALKAGPDIPVGQERISDEEIVFTLDAPGNTQLLFQESYDPSWQAAVDGKPLQITRDPAHFMLMDVPAGRHEIRLRFETPPEIVFGRLATVLGLVILIKLLRKSPLRSI